MKLGARSREHRLLGGVSSAIGEAYDLDVTLVRLAFVLLALAWGIGLVLYGVLWVAVPEAGASRPGGRLDLGSLRDRIGASAHAIASGWRRHDRRTWPRPLSRRWIAIGLVAGGTAILLASFGAFSWLTPARAIGLALTALGAGALWSGGQG